MKVLVIIISYNFEPWMERCLGSLRQSEHPADVLVIDNGSKDLSIKRIQKDYPEVRLIVNGKNLGFGQANNIGMQIAWDEKYDFAFLMNQDAWIEPNTIGTLVALSAQYSNYGILSPVHLTGKGDKPDPGFGQYAGIHTIAELPNEELITLPFVNAAFWMIPVPILKKIGGFSPLFYHYGEDKDFVNRLEYHRFKIGYSPKVVGYHDREYRPLSHEGFLRNEYVYHLSEYANINYSWTKAFGYGVLAIVKKMITALCNGKPSLSNDYLTMLVKLIKLRKKICLYRKTNRMSYPQSIQRP
jgi:GT2 family glycosyltransferase